MTHRSLDRRWLLVALATVIIAVAGGYAINSYVHRAADAEAGQIATAISADALANTVLTACAGGGDDADVLRAAGLCSDAADTKVEVDDATKLVEGAQGRQGDAGTQGPIGPRGPGPLVSQILNAIESYCAANDDCRGPAGKKGKAGSDGTNGADGATGPAGADGSNGSDGANGKDGKDGRGIKSVRCNEAGRWVVTYSDDSSEDAGECRAVVQP